MNRYRTKLVFLVPCQPCLSVYIGVQLFMSCMAVDHERPVIRQYKQALESPDSSAGCAHFA
jgi:hypothetical protein